LNEALKISKKLKITYNDLMMSLFSKAMGRYCDEHCVDQTYKALNVAIPFGTKNMEACKFRKGDKFWFIFTLYAVD